MKTKSVSFEELGLDLRKISDKELEDLAYFIEKCIKEELSRLLDQRLLGYVTTISVELTNKAINVAIDLEADSYLISHVSLESMLDQVLRHVFTKVRLYVAERFRKTEGTDSE
uniref:DUF3194 domain-containing protein n=1 Tax=Ignisphaera aggregans TaxID=334771 RepID=A0A7C2ZN76_9CREN